MLEIHNLVVETDNKRILNGVSLMIKPGEIHAIMGPNGSGKSSLSLALMGHPRYKITKGKVLIDGNDITTLTPDKRAKLGLFLAMQYPVAVPGVSVANFLRTAARNLKDKVPVPGEFVSEVKKEIKNLKLDENFISRGINDGFSGGEKKKVEILQMEILKPKYAVLDETDSGLDIDALKIVASGIKKASGPKVGIMLITHYQRILKYIQPDFVHIFVDGKIAKSGSFKLAEELEKEGYSAYV
jgi:Fe-S cluster assembly ATP-binding protein